MSIEIVKNIKEANCVTHGGTFHADDVFATVILSKIMPEIRIIRLLEVTEQMPENAIIYDIGAGNFDHHQFGGNGEREGVKYAACGLIWKQFGKEVLKKYEIEDLEYTFKYIDRSLIQFIDSVDNGQLPPSNTNYKYIHISKIIGWFNPNWNEKIDDDKRFLEAVKFAEIVFDEFMHNTVSKMKARNLIELEIEKTEDRILILKEYMPWKELLLESKNPKAKNINFVVFPSKRGGYNVYSVPKELGSFENRKSMPEAWRGLRDEALQKVTGVATARFCHNGGFICAAENFEDIVLLARIADKS